jgi:hypothetical protein
MAARDVYNVASNETIAYLRACVDVAASNGRIPFFGFCRSGTQHAAIDAAIGGVRIHLWRSPREQFCSYNWPENDYFVPSTLLQLIWSRPLWPRVASLVPVLARDTRVCLIRMAPTLAPWHQLRLARAIASALAVEDAYALVYLAWQACQQSLKTSDFKFSLSELYANAALRRSFEDRFNVSLADLHPTPHKIIEGVNYSRIERRVERLS